MTETPPVANFNPEQVGALSPESLTSFAASLKQAGFDAVDVDAKLAATPPAAPANDKSEQAVGEIFPAPETPDTYKFDYSQARLATDSAALAKFTAELRGALHAAEVPDIMGQSVLDALDRAAALYPPTQTDVERQATFLEERFKLVRAFGQAGADEVGLLASAAWGRLPPEWRAKIDEQHGFSTAQGQMALAGIERAFRARQARKP